MRRTRKIVCGSVFLLLVNVAATTASNVQTSDDAILLRLSIPKPDICTGTDTLKAEVELRNLGSRPLKIAPVGLNKGESFWAFDKPSDTSPGIRWFDVIRDPWPSSSEWRVVLLPISGTYRDEDFVISVADKFFNKPGFYKVNVTYGVPPYSNELSDPDLFSDFLESNWVYFRIDDCP